MTTSARTRRNHWMQGASLAGLTLLGVASAAHAQDAAPGQSAVTEVVITGSRTIRDGSTAPTPVTVQSAEQLATSSPRDIAQALASLPAFNGSNSANTPQMAAGANQTGSFLNLRDLTAKRTLVLLDGRRVAPAAGDGTVDFSMLPQSLISRVDIVTGGASAVYGSDAVAGVVNVVLDTKFTGVKGLIQGGISDKGDVGSYKFNLTAGGSFLDDKLHLLASYGYNRSNPVYNGLSARDWANAGDGRIIIGTGTSQFSDLYYDVNQKNYNGGVILPGSGPNNVYPVTGQGLKFLVNPAGGTALSSVYNIGVSDAGGNLLSNANDQVGGDGSRNAISLTALAEGYTTFGRATYDLTDNWNIYIQGMTAQSHNRYEVSTDQHVPTATQYTIYQGNPYIPAGVAAALASATFSTVAVPAAGGNPAIPAVTGDYSVALENTCNTGAGLATITDKNQPNGSNVARCFVLGRITQDGPRVTGDVLNNSFDLVTGFQGEIFGGYRLSGYYEHGEDRYRTLTYGNLIQEHAYASIDAVANPAIGGVPGVAAGTPVCRVSITNPGLYPGCVPQNPFGYGSETQAAINYIYGTSFHRLLTRQDVAAIDIAGEPFNLPAGPVSLALGVAEYRQLYVAQISDPTSQQVKQGVGIRGFPPGFVNVLGGYSFTNQQPFAGSVNDKELYGEVSAPLLKDLPLIEDFSINLAGRYTDYSNSGGVKTYKVGLDYKPIDSIRFRGTYSRDIRAPGPLELFQGNGQGTTSIIDPFRLGGVATSIYQSTIGNKNLVPEKADTYAAGVVFTPTWIPGLTASVDWYSITVNDAIGSLTAQQTVDFCFAGNTSLCPNIQRVGPNTTDPVNRVILPFLNLTQLKTDGLDIELSYRHSLTIIPGTLTSRLLLNVLGEFNEQPPGGSALIIHAGELPNAAYPRDKATASFNYDNGPVTLYVQANYISSGVQSNVWTEAGFGANTIRNNRIPSNTIFSVTGKYRFGADQQYEAFLTINNLFDKDPPPAAGTNVSDFQPTNNQLYDTIGRYYTTGLKFRF